MDYPTLRIDPKRSPCRAETGIFVRALGTDGVWQSVDICFLDQASLLAWLRWRGDSFAEEVVARLLGHA